MPAPKKQPTALIAFKILAVSHPFDAQMAGSLEARNDLRMQYKDQIEELLQEYLDEINDELHEIAPGLKATLRDA